MEYTWEEIEDLIQKLQKVRDSYIKQISPKLMTILYRNLKVLEQEARFFQEIENYFKKAYNLGTQEYYQKHQDLQKVSVPVNLRLISINDPDIQTISPSVLEYIIPFIGGNDYDSN